MSKSIKRNLIFFINVAVIARFVSWYFKKDTLSDELEDLLAKKTESIDPLNSGSETGSIETNTSDDSLLSNSMNAAQSEVGNFLCQNKTAVKNKIKNEFSAKFKKLCGYFAILKLYHTELPRDFNASTDIEQQIQIAHTLMQSYLCYVAPIHVPACNEIYKNILEIYRHLALTRGEVSFSPLYTLYGTAALTDPKKARVELLAGKYVKKPKIIKQGYLLVSLPKVPI